MRWLLTCVACGNTFTASSGARTYCDDCLMAKEGDDTDDEDATSST